MNPFFYGGAVGGNYFVDREKEIATLLADLKQQNKIFLISPRRYGKTSLIFKIAKLLKKENFLIAYLDLYKVTSLEQFASLYAKALAMATETKIEKVIKFIQSIISSLRPKITISPEGEISIRMEVEPEKKDVFSLLEKLYNAPEEIALKRKKKFVLIFDEFQEILSFGGEGIEKSMRADIQYHKNVGYVFSGSKKSLIIDLVSNSSRAFYKMGKVFFLNKIPHDKFFHFIKNGFVKTRFKISKAAVSQILSVTSEIPYYVQYLAHEVWNNCIEEKKVDEERVLKTACEIVTSQSPIFLTIWDSLSLSQRRVLQAIASSGGENIFSHEFMRGYHLGPIGSVQTSIKMLLKKGILEKENKTLNFSDIWFKEWVKVTL